MRPYSGSSHRAPRRWPPGRPAGGRVKSPRMTFGAKLCASAPRREPAPRCMRARRHVVRQSDHFQRAGAVMPAAQEAALLQRRDQAVDARFGLELQRLLHLLEARREAGRFEVTVDDRPAARAACGSAWLTHLPDRCRLPLDRDDATEQTGNLRSFYVGSRAPSSVHECAFNANRQRPSAGRQMPRTAAPPRSAGACGGRRISASARARRRSIAES